MRYSIRLYSMHKLNVFCLTLCMWAMTSVWLEFSKDSPLTSRISSATSKSAFSAGEPVKEMICGRYANLTRENEMWRELLANKIGWKVFDHQIDILYSMWWPHSFLMLWCTNGNRNIKLAVKCKLNTPLYLSYTKTENSQVINTKESWENLIYELRN